jgi:hypothetical protein
MTPQRTSLFTILTVAAAWCGLAAFGLALAAAGATKPFPGFGLFLAGTGIGMMAMLAVDFWRDSRRRDRPPGGDPPG